MSERYPLEAAATVRAGARERAERAVTEARRALDAARAATLAAREALRRFTAETTTRLARAPEPTTGAALERDRAFRAHLQSERVARVREVATASAAERRAGEALRAARRGLASAHGEEKVVERHRERWQQDRRRLAARAEEEELEEIVRT